MSETRTRPRERDGECLSVHLLDKSHAASIEPLSPEISSFLFPMKLDNFLKEHYEKRRALAIKVHPSLREKRLEFVKTLLHNFNPRSMLENSNSTADGISVWMKLVKTGEIRSMKVSPENALTSYQAGNSLYFRGTEDIEAAFIPSFMQQLGFSFGSYFRDGARRGECEVFAAHPGHVTTWHTDFQENFTIQLMGQKKWYLRKADVDFPYRACATHFTDPAAANILRTQHAIHHLDTTSNGKQFSMIPEDIEETCETVVLQAGDVLYHPAGLWHKVETQHDVSNGQNSLSVNFSLFPLQWQELFQESLQTMMLRMSHWRRPVAMHNGNRQFGIQMANAMIQSLKAELDQLTGEHILPKAIVDSCKKSLPRIITFDEEGKIVMLSSSGKNKSTSSSSSSSSEKDVKKFVSGFEKSCQDIFSSSSSQEIFLKRNPLAVIVEVNPKLLELMPDNDNNNDDGEDEDEDESDEDDECCGDHDRDDDDEEDEEAELNSEDFKSDEDEDKSSKSSSDNNNTKKTVMITFDLWSNFVADESNFGAPGLKMTLRVPASLRKVFISIANSRAEKALSSKVFESSLSSGDVLPFLFHVGYFAIVEK